MSTLEQRALMGKAILDFEARRDGQGRLVVYNLPPDDGGGTYEVAGINDRFHPEEAKHLAELIHAGRFDEAERYAIEFIGEFTDAVATWTSSVAVESYLRDCAFNRGPRGAARIVQRATGVADDEVVGDKTRRAIAAAEQDPRALLAALRAARERYERDVAHRDESSRFWRGLTNRWNKALTIAETFLGAPVPAVAAAAPPVAAPAKAILPALRGGSRGKLVRAWQSFLSGQGFDAGPSDGAFGDRTHRATIGFQQKHGLAADGIAGRETLLAAMGEGFELIEEPAADTSGSNFPPKSAFAPVTSTAARQAMFGKFAFVSAPQPGNPEHIRILGNWEAENIMMVALPQLRRALGPGAPAGMPFHRRAAAQLQGLWSDWEEAGLLDRVLSYDGAFVPRFIRGSRKTLSNHAFGSAFDINARHNPLGARPKLVGETGSTRELVSIAGRWGFYWGGHFDSRPDGMHFEIAVLR